MKHTKNMIITETTESRELAIFTENSGAIYSQHIKPVINNLHKKYVKGTYSAALAIDLYYQAVIHAAVKEYCRLFASLEDTPHIFDVTARYTAAADLESFFLDEVMEG